jgi:phosphoglycolate phosphatase-like HAD superfamily hydrolase
MIKEVIFDFDGTVADSFDVIMSFFVEYKQRLGLDKFGKEEIEIYRNKGVKELIKESKVSVFRISKVISEMRKGINESVSEVKPFVGMINLLNKLKNKELSLGVMSTNGEKTINKLLEKNKIEVFDYVVGKGSLFGKDKVIKSILKKRKLKSDEVLYVGDEVRDIEACKKLGIKIAAVTWGFSSKKLLAKNKPDFLVNKAEEILKLV